MNKYTLLLIFFSIFHFSSSFAIIKKEYAVERIPAHLKRDANAIIRYSKTEFFLVSSNKILEKSRLVITILNKKAELFSQIAVGYDKFSKVKSLNGALYDSTGKRIRTLSIYDFSSCSGYSMYEDNRVKAGRLSHGLYPYTVEFEYETQSSNTMFYPVWYAQHSYNLAVEKSAFIMNVPDSSFLRYKERNLIVHGEIRTEKNRRIYTWSAENLKALLPEPFSVPLTEESPSVWSAPVNFSIDGNRGNMNTWDSLGKFIGELNKGRDKLSFSTVEKVKELVKNEKNEMDKIRRVYQFLQESTRYVSIQVGIGGIQPFEASIVEEKGYGDCKALSNYTKSLLNAIGINANYVLIRAGKDASEILTDFPNAMFNHATLCIPLQNKDTVWLECTSQTNPFGYCGNFTGNRKALMITENGGVLVNTPAYSVNENMQVRKADIVLDSSGSAVAWVDTKYSGLEQEELSWVVNNKKRDEQKEWLYKKFKLPSFDIKKFHFVQDKGIIPSVKETVELQITNCASSNGKRLFIYPNLLNRLTYNVENKKRRTDIFIKNSFFYSDTVTYSLPSGYMVEFIPAKINIENTYGKYSCTFQMQENVLTYVRVFSMNKGKYSSSEYDKFSEFLKMVSMSDKAHVICSK